MILKIGNKVKFINENLEGTVKSILSNEFVLVEATDGFDHKVHPAEIVVINIDNTVGYRIDKSAIKDRIKSPSTKNITSDILTRYITNTKFQFEKVIEIDLHLEQLVEFPLRLDDRLRLHTQLQHAKNCLDAAIKQKFRKLVFIHGVGQGILKTELRNVLGKYDNIIIKDADYLAYGQGATEVIIK